MPTIIDSLVLELGLDPKKLNDGQKAALAQFQKTKQEALKAGKEAEDAANRAVNMIGRVKAQVLTFAAAAFGASTISGFVEKITTMGAETGRTAKILDQSTESLSRWRGLAVVTGAGAAAMTSTIHSLVAGFHEFAISGQSNVIPILRQLGLTITDSNDKFKGMELFLEIAEKFSKMDPAKAAVLGARMGIPAEVVAVMIRGRKALEDLIEKQKQLGEVTDRDAKANQALLESWNSMSLAAENLGRKIVTELTPALIPMLDRWTKIFSELSRGQIISPDSVLGRLMNSNASKDTPSLSDGPAAGNIGGGGSNGGHAAPWSEREAFYRAYAKKKGLNPDVVIATVAAEGKNGFVGDKGTSFGDFQLHYKNNIPGLSNPGLGDEFTKKTGKHASDPALWQETGMFSIDKMAAGGLKPWHGWKGNPWAAHTMPPSGAAAAAASDGSRSDNSRRTEVNVQKIEVNAPHATDAEGIARGIQPALERNVFSQQANGGPN